MNIAELKQRLESEEFSESSNYNQNAVGYLYNWDGVSPIEFDNIADFNPDSVTEILHAVGLRTRAYNNANNTFCLVILL